MIKTIDVTIKNIDTTIYQPLPWVFKINKGTDTPSKIIPIIKKNIIKNLILMIQQNTRLFECF